MRQKRKVISLLLVLSMIMSLFTGLSLENKEAEAADENKIELGTAVQSAGFYRYDSANITLKNDKKMLYHFTVSVDSGYMTSDKTKIVGVAGKGLIADNTSTVTMEELNNAHQYELISFDFSTGVLKDEIQSFLRDIHFVPVSGTVQKVSVSASSISDMTTTVNGKTCNLQYFNGHFYGYVNDSVTWKNAYTNTKVSTFNGMKGYLLTLTSRQEDRFVYSIYKTAGKGWMGTTRATSTNGLYDTDTITWNDLGLVDQTVVTNNAWRWVCGPEASSDNGHGSGVYGYQNAACGFAGVNNSIDGGFYTYDGWYSNWRNNGTNIEPNGGGPNVNQQEGYGYYGEEVNGSWNDNADSEAKVYYVEFGGYSDDQTNVEEAGEVVVTQVKNSDGTTPTAMPVASASANPSGSPASSAGATATSSASATAASSAAPTITPQANELTGKPVITYDAEELAEADGELVLGATLTADVSSVGPAGATYDYQWYIKESDGTLTPVDGKNKQSIKVSSTMVNKTIVVKITATGEYIGSAESDPLAPITGTVSAVNDIKDNLGIDVVRVGTVLHANLDSVLPEDSHDSLSYQWYISNTNKTTGETTYTTIAGATGENYVVTADTINKNLVVEITGTGNCYGIITSASYDATRTAADVAVTDSDDPTSTTRTITITPTDENTIYALLDEDGKIVNTVTVDGSGNALTPNVSDHAGYYQGVVDGTIKFIELDKSKTYIISQIQIKKTSETDEVVSPAIPTTNVKTEYDDKGTSDKSDDTATIIIDPALKDTVYAVLKKEADGSYSEVMVTKGADGNYVVDSTSTTGWSAGNEEVVKFTGLSAGATYKIVAKASTDEIKNVTPSEVTGGSGDVTTPATPTATATPSPKATAGTGANQATSNPVNSVNGSTATSAPIIIYTKEEQDNVTKFIYEYVTDPSGKIITTITDLTKDIISSGAAAWNKLTTREQEAVNAKLKAAGCNFTFEQLLKKSKSYKIPTFKVIKFMKKGTKAKLQLIKCSGAKIACTSTNKKIATVDKKGVIKAKKVGKATLTFTAVKGKYTNRYVINIQVKKKFKNAKEKKIKAKAIKTPTVLISKKRVLKKSSKIVVSDLVKGSKVKFEALNKKVLKINNKGKYTGLKRGNSLVRIKVNQNKKVYWMYVYVVIY